MTRAAADGFSAERHRLAAVSSLVNVVARHVDDLIQVPADELPGWLTGISVPTGWRIVHLKDKTLEPTRIAVCGQQPDGGWDGCETMTMFSFTGEVPDHVMRGNADCTLRDLDAIGIKTDVLDTTGLAGATSVRSSGCFATAGLWVWAQYSTYIAGSKQLGKGIFIQHAVFIESTCRAQLSTDVAQLCDEVYRAFVAIVVRS